MEFNKNKLDLTQSDVSVAAYFGIEESRVEELQQKGMPLFQDILSKMAQGEQLNTIIILDSLLTLSNSDREDAYLCFVSGSLMSQLEMLHEEGVSGDPMNKY